jgi:hypothetical protein
MKHLRAVSVLAAGLGLAVVASCSDNTLPTQTSSPNAAVAVLPDQALAVDQTSGALTGTTWGCGYQTQGIMAQSFKPSWRTLGAIDLALRAGGEFPDDGALLALDLYHASAAGYSLVGTSSAFVPGPVAVGTTVTVRFRFLPPLLVKPGDGYRMEWMAPGDEVLTWYQATTPYADGIPWVCGIITPHVPAFDFGFTTYRVGR